MATWADIRRPTARAGIKGQHQKGVAAKAGHMGIEQQGLTAGADEGTSTMG